MWELWTGIAPFKDVGIGQLGYRVATLKERPPLPPGMPDDYAKVMQECWAPEADSRPNFEHVLKKLRKMLSTAVAAATAAGRHNQRFLKVLKSKI